MERIIALVDMDCFYVQVEQRLNPALKNKPCAVVQYKKWKGGGIIAVGYEARACGVTRNMRGDDAKKKCPDIILVHVPEVRGKADLTKYREAGAEVIEVLSQFCSCVERASVDEAYLDITSEVDQRLGKQNVQSEELPNTHVVGWKDEDVEQAAEKRRGTETWLNTIYGEEDFGSYGHRLAVGAALVEEMRQAVFMQTGFRCSAGIAANKMLAKLACGINKPNKQTVLPPTSVHGLFTTLPVQKIRHLGGKLGESVVQQLKVEYMADLCQFSEKELQNQFGDKNGCWLYGVCRGIEHEAVSARQLPKSIGCSKNFRGREQLDTRDKVKFWLGELSKEVEERLNKDRALNNRRAASLVVHIHQLGIGSSSRTCALPKYDAKKIADDALALLHKFNSASVHQAAWTPAVVNLGVSAGKFVSEDTNGTASITSFMSTSPCLSQSSQVAGSASFMESTQQRHPSQTKKKTSTITDFCSKLPRKTDSDEQITEQTDLSRKFIKDKTKLKDSPLNKFLVPNQINTSQEGSVLSSTPSRGSSKKGFFARKEQNIFSSSSLSVSTATLQSVTSVSKVENRDSNAAKITFNSKKESDVETASNHCGFVCSYPTQANITREMEPFKISDDRENVKQETVSLVDPRTYTHNTQTDTVDVPQIGQSSSFNQKHSECSTSAFPDKQDTLLVTESSSEPLPVDDTVSIDSADMMSCERCGQMVSAWDLPEHLDFHFAQDLQSEQNQTAAPSSARNCKRKADKTALPSGAKKSRLSVSNSSPSLYQFFSKK